MLCLLPSLQLPSRSLRDLEGADGVAVVLAMLASLRNCALEVYGVPASKLRVFFHYQPQYYRLHAHCTRIEHACPGSEVTSASMCAHAPTVRALSPSISLVCNNNHKRAPRVPLSS